ncbi:MAG TPA: hypothetical protein PLV96_03620, partial [Methanoregulaceae archaeon]|nr:hypothetical protein [Methanoregulaceae archaeon]
DDRTLREISAHLATRKLKTSPFADKPKAEKGEHFVTPDLVCEIVFAEWTPDGKLRHPRYLGLRDDKPARDVVRENQ